MPSSASEAVRVEPGGNLKVRKRRSLSPIWFIPIVALGIAGFIAWRTVEQQGPLIQIGFESAEGLEQGKTRVKYKDVDVGVVEEVRLSGDLQSIQVTIRMDRAVEAYLTDKTSFWIVRPRVGVGGVSGLGTLLSGAFVEMDTSQGGQPQREFTGLEEPPLIRSTAPGRRFVLTAGTVGSVSRGAPIYFRGLQVGQIMGYELDDQNSQIVTHVFIRAPHDELVRVDTKFWDAGGIRASAGGSGVDLVIPPLQALLVGGIEFASFPGSATAELAAPGHRFHLYESKDAITNEIGGPTVAYLAYFDSSVRGLRPGAPVEFRGIRVGTVTNVELELDPVDATVSIPVTLRMEPSRIRFDGGAEAAAQPYFVVGKLVERGLRAQLATSSILTGDLYVALDFFPGLPRAELTMKGDIAELPTVPSQLDQITASVSRTLERVSALPLEGLVKDVRGALEAVQQLAGGPETRQSLVALEGSLTGLESLVGAFQRDLPPIVASLRGVADSANATLRDVRSTVSSVDQLFGTNSQLRYDLVQALRQLGSAARSIREFADYLDRHPDALIRGRQGNR